MTHYAGLAEQEVEELLEELWTLDEHGRGSRHDAVTGSKLPDAEAVLERLVARDYVRIDGPRVRMTDAGRELASRQIRRHRLAEFLLAHVLAVRDEAQINRTACAMEHALSSEVTDSVCSFLGHPSHCPHGKPIPPGPCCRTLSTAVAPLVQPLDRLPVGTDARIVYIVPRDAELLTRLSSLGILPSVTVRLEQARPAAVLRIGETTLALDPQIASQIYVKRLATR